jgi:hypothetical protein
MRPASSRACLLLAALAGALLPPLVAGGARPRDKEAPRPTRVQTKSGGRAPAAPRRPAASRQLLQEDWSALTAVGSFQVKDGPKITLNMATFAFEAPLYTCAQVCQMRLDPNGLYPLWVGSTDPNTANGLWYACVCPALPPP